MVVYVSASDIFCVACILILYCVFTGTVTMLNNTLYATFQQIRLKSYTYRFCSMVNTVLWCFGHHD